MNLSRKGVFSWEIFKLIRFRSWIRLKKQKDREMVLEQREKNKALEDEIEKKNIEQQKLKEELSLIQLDVKRVTQRIVCHSLMNDE